MINIPLQAIPNQSFSIQLDSVNNFNLEIKSIDNTPDIVGTAIMTVTISLNSDPTPRILVSNARATPNSPIIYYPYLQNFGEFIFQTDNEEYPDYHKFDITQFLFYFSPVEIEAIRNDNQQS